MSDCHEASAERDARIEGRLRRAGTAGLLLMVGLVSAPPRESLAMDAQGEPSLQAPDWSLAPIRWDGNLAFEMRLQGIADQPRRLQDVEVVNIRGASYLWQPWFAQVEAGVGLVRSREQGMGDEGRTSPVVPDTDSNTITGSGALTVFPVSRFPFRANYDRTDSRASEEITASDFTNTRWGLRQNYRTPEGMTNYTLSFDRSVLESASFGRDSVDLLAAGLNTTSGPQAFDLSGSHARNLRSNTGESSDLDRVIARHAYRPGSLASVDSLASLTNENFKLLVAGVPADSRSQFAQANTFGTWRPYEGAPLYLTGGGRVFQTSVQNNGTVSDSQTLSGNIAANYALNRNTNLSGGASLTRNSTESTTDLISTETGALTYVSAPIPAGIFSFTWNAGGNVGNQHGGISGNRRTAGGQGAYNLTRVSPIGEASSVTYTLGQSLSHIYDTVTANSDTLTNSGSVSLQSAPSPESLAYVSLSGADSRTRGFNENQFQLVNLQANGQLQLSRNSTGAANLTTQGIRQTTPGAPDPGYTFSSSGTATYQHMRAFDVARLRASTLFTVNQARFATRLEGDVNAPRDRVNQSLEQRFDYSIGRLEMRLSARVARIEGLRNTLVFFRINRQFGSL